METSLLKAALSYASKGISVHPLYGVTDEGKCTCKNKNCNAPGKHPKNKNWPEKATTNKDQITSWWEKDPNANIGILTGEKSGIAVIDIDVGKVDGIAEFKKLLDLQIVTDTFMIESGSKGLHAYYAYPQEIKIKNNTGIRPGIDIRGDGGYIVAPPSKNAKGQYTILSKCDFNPKTLPPFPIQILTYQQEKILQSQDCSIIEGKRNDTLFKLALKELMKGNSFDNTFSLITEQNTNHCIPPLLSNEISTLVTSAYNFFQKRNKSITRTASGNYAIKDGCICLITQNKSGEEIFPPLSNFVAKIKNEIIRDDGSNKNYFLVIEGATKDGEILPDVEVAAEVFPNMVWVSKNWGAKAIINSGFGSKDSLRAAIQELSIGHQTINEYLHTGFREINGTYHYLTSGGAISPTGMNTNVRVNLDTCQLGRYQLPQTPTGEELVKAIKASMSALDKDIPDHVSFPIFSSIYRAVIGDLKELNFTTFIVGGTGVMKTTYAGHLMGHFGRFNNLNVPESWVSTAYSLERKAELLKDSLFFIDDFIAGETNNKVVEYIIRGQGNRVGRTRMRPDGSLRVTSIPRCLLMTTGEDVPTGHSLRSRMMIIEIKKGDITIAAINRIKQQSHLFSSATSGFVSYLAGKYESKKITVPKKHDEFTNSFSSFKGHPRSPSIVADLLVGFTEFLEFAVEKSAISKDEAAELFEKRAMPAFNHLIQQQNKFHESSDPIENFISNIRSALITGKAHLKSKGIQTIPDPENWGWLRDRDGGWAPGGEHIGWLVDNEVWLQPEAAFNMANKLSASYSQRIHMHKDSLWSRMADRGLLTVSQGEARNTVKRQIGDQRPRVIIFSDLSLFRDEAPEIEAVTALSAPHFAGTPLYTQEELSALKQLQKLN